LSRRLQKPRILHGRFASTMTEAIDIYRAAKLVIDPHGEDAALCVAAKTAVFDVEGDDEGAAI
jgi:hypothetical protein